MDEDSQDAKLLGSLSKHRSPTFTKEEVKCIISLIEKYKNIVLNKATNSSACHAKEMAWTKLTEVFNSQGFKHSRTTENIKCKWDNLKRDARKASKNLMDIDHEEFDDIMSQTVNLLVESENTGEIKDFSEELKVLEDENSIVPQHNSDWDVDTDKDLNLSTDNREARRRFVKRTMNFTPQECSILLKCVRQEKKYVFNKINTSKANRLKNQAWMRVTRRFNKLSPHKRSTKTLQTKFTNMKKVVRKESNSLFDDDIDIDKKYINLENNIRSKKIKTEPMFCSEDETEQDVACDVEEPDDSVDNFDGLNSDNNSNHEAPDPLSTVLSSDSGFGFNGNDSEKSSETKEIVKLKLELLQCQLETVKLERERLERVIRSEAVANESRAIEMALRLRAARLEAVSAAMKLTPGHPALQFSHEEACAQEYLSKFHQT